MSKSQQAKEANRPIGAFSHDEEMAMSGDTIVYFCPRCWYAFPAVELRDSHSPCADLLKGVK
jgi:hypothetical protein